MILYSKPNCPGCTALKAQLKAQEQEYKEIVIGVDISREDFMVKFPQVRTVPYLVKEEA